MIIPLFGKRIRELRLQRGLSMRQLASAANLKSAAFISDLERGFRYPSPKIMAKIAAALGVPLAQLRSCDPRPPLAELAELANRNEEWSPALRQLIEAANQGLAARDLLQLLRSHRISHFHQPELPDISSQ